MRSSMNHSRYKKLFFFYRYYQKNKIISVQLDGGNIEESVREAQAAVHDY